LNPQKQTVLDCRRLKGDSFAMGSFFTILTKALSAKPELGVKVLYEENEVPADFFEEEEDEEALQSLLGEGHLQLKNDPNLIKHLMKEIETSDLETQINDTGLLAHAAELDSNVDTLVAEGGESLVKLLEGSLQHDNAALVRQSSVLLKELTRRHPEIFSEQTAKSMVQAMGKWAQRPPMRFQNQSELVSSKTAVMNLAEGVSSLKQSKLVESITLDEGSIQNINSILQRSPSLQHSDIMEWMSEMTVC